MPLDGRLNNYASIRQGEVLVEKALSISTVAFRFCFPGKFQRDFGVELLERAAIL